MIAKTQRYKGMKLYIVGIDLSSAFDTINREKLLQILAPLIGKDEYRMTKALLANTELELKMKNANTVSFKSNVGSPQGDGISGPLFNIYFEAALRDLRHAINNATPTPSSDHEYTKSHITVPLLPDHNYYGACTHPEEEIYADDADFITTDINKRNSIEKLAEQVLTKHNLLVSKGKT